MQYLAFPIASNSKVSGSISSMQKSSSAISNKSSNPLKRVKISQSRRETEPDRYIHQLYSPWHVAPLHLPIVGQICWPHMSDGFSISLWLKVEVPKGMDALNKVKKQKRNLLDTSRENSVDITGKNRNNCSILLQINNLCNGVLFQNNFHERLLGMRKLTTLCKFVANLTSAYLLFALETS